MSLFSLLRGPDVNRGVEEYRAVPGAVLLDVRERSEEHTSELQSPQ